jgi:hypothetical protein
MLVWSLRLAPAAVCILAVLSAFNQDQRMSGRGPNLQPLGSNQIAQLPASYQQEHNDFSAFTFEWTNLRGSTSSISSFSPARRTD